MSVTEDARQRLRAARKAVPQRPGWRPLEFTDLAPHVPVLAFDASLSNVGWVLAEACSDGVAVHEHGTIKPQTTATSHLATWEKADWIRGELGSARFRRILSLPYLKIAVEAPIVGPGHRTESSLVAGLMVWMIDPDHVEVVSPTHVSAVLLGDPGIKSDKRKAAVKAAVCRLVPEAAGRGFNEHERDGLSVGIVTLHDLKGES